MKITKKQLKRIIREEYSRLKIRELIKESLITEAGRFTSMMPKTGPMAEVAPFFEELGGGMWKYKLTSTGATFKLPDHRGEDFGYYVMVDHYRGVYKFKWIRREPTTSGRRSDVRVIRPKNGWEVGSIPRDIKNAVDEIMYDIATHEAEPENWTPGAGNAS